MIRLIILLALIICTPLHGASFDCTSTVTRIEASICGDNVLSALDSILATDYEKTTTLIQYRSAPPSKSLSSATLIRGQRRWMKQRNGCRDNACIKESYMARITELRRVNCELDPERECGPETSKILPMTADGRLLLLTRFDCRSGDGPTGFKDQTIAIQVQADCIEAGLYDPCDDAGGKWGDAQCAWAHMDVANRRIARSERRLIELASAGYPQGRLSEDMASASARWVRARDEYCKERNELFAKAPETQEDFDSRRAAGETDFGEALGYCARRLAEERASALESYVTYLGNGTSAEALGELRLFLKSRPEF